MNFPLPTYTPTWSAVPRPWVRKNTRSPFSSSPRSTGRHPAGGTSHGGTRNAEFDKIFIGVIHQAAAVKPGAGETATPVIRFANLAHQFVHRGFALSVH